MKQKKTQAGSIHLIVISLLAIAILGALGFILWRNLNNSGSKSLSSKTITLRLSSHTSILFTYPGNWIVGSLDSDTIADGTVEISEFNPVHITSPSKNINVSFRTFNYYVIGQSCSESYNQPEDFYSVYESTPIKNFSGAYYVQGLTNGQVIGGFDARLQKSDCEGHANSYISYELDKKDIGNYGLENNKLGTFQASIEFAADIDGPGSTQDMYSRDYVLKNFASDEFKNAKELLLSAELIEQ